MKTIGFAGWFVSFTFFIFQWNDPDQIFSPPAVTNFMESVDTNDGRHAVSSELR